LSELARAGELLDAEIAAFETVAGNELLGGGALQAAMEQGASDLAYLPQAKKFVEWRLIDKGERLEASKHMYELAETQVQRDSKRAKKLEEKLEKLLGGYVVKARQTVAKAASLAEERETITVETEVFRMLRAREEKAIETRVQELQDMVEAEKERNSRLQTRYKELKLLGRKLDEKLA